ncbi:hypothetical protein RchiOBHm_Chr4g0426861 [Rosa chinensis]|uniref:Uncharacterized protein n=1 Tax=Rosa chinensis TaxID=74649 RepID=A0A2P6QZG7_ROSCH|nr:hypothetical protein RchiOBHm_Chr4g0426861 [Rosa chinensis]
MAHQMCFDCLQRRIESEFSGKLVFIHGLSDSAFPFGSNAVVQVQVQFFTPLSLSSLCIK